MFRVLSAVALLFLMSAAAAPAKPRTDVRAEVRQFIKEYIDAENRNDGAAMMEMMSRKPEVSSVTMGVLMRGWDVIHGGVDAAAEAPSDSKLSLGEIEVVMLGSDFALSVTSFDSIPKPGQGNPTLHGTMTLVLEKSGGKWKVLHEHYSMQFPEMEVSSIHERPSS